MFKKRLAHLTTDTATVAAHLEWYAEPLGCEKAKLLEHWEELAGVIGAEFTADRPDALAWFFLKQTLLVGIALAVLLALVPWVKRLMAGVR